MLVPTILFGGYYFYANVLNRPRADVYAVHRGTAISAVYGTVTVTSKQTLLVNAQNAGILKMAAGFGTTVEANGIAVKQNELLATITDDVGQRALDQARKDYEIALSHQKLGPGSAQGLKTARDQLRAYDRLPQGSIPLVQREAARDEVMHLEMAIQNESLELERVLSTATTVLRNAEEAMKRNEVRAPIDGVIVLAFFNDGSFVANGAGLFSISSKDLYISGLVNEEDVGKLKPGMKAEMRLYAYTNTVFIATLTAVLPSPDANSSRYTVTLQMDHPPDNLLFGLTGEMNVILGRKENALIIPARGLLVDQVLLVVDGVVSQRTVKVNFKSLEFVEVAEGLHEGDQVIVNDQDAFRENERVRPMLINPPTKATDHPAQK